MDHSKDIKELLKPLLTRTTDSITSYTGQNDGTVHVRLMSGHDGFYSPRSYIFVASPESYAYFAKYNAELIATEGAPTQESDPNGKSANEPGSKLDAGKNRLSLVMHGFARALEEVGRVGTFGANKYTDNGWVSVPQGLERYTDAAYRHLLKEAQGQLIDSDSQLLHAAHTAWNALARLELTLRK